jgi:hypothetical protein
MRHSLYLAAAAAAAALPVLAVAPPASAGLAIFIDYSGTIVACLDNTACDTNPAPGVIQLAPTTINGVLVEGELSPPRPPRASPTFSTIRF